MSGWIVALILVINLILQSTVFQYIDLLGVKPDSAIVIVIALSTFLGKERGAIIGAAAGMLQDILFGKPLGIITLSYMLTGYLVGQNSDKVFKENLVVPMVFTAGATLLKYFISIFFNYALGIQTPVLKYIQQYLFIELIYNCIISIVVYRILYLAYNKRLAWNRLKLNKKKRY